MTHPIRVEITEGGNTVEAVEADPVEIREGDAATVELEEGP